MPRPYVTLAEYPFDPVRLACTKCERRGKQSFRLSRDAEHRDRRDQY
jgi:hypothetical protein